MKINLKKDIKDNKSFWEKYKLGIIIFSIFLLIFVKFFASLIPDFMDFIKPFTNIISYFWNLYCKLWEILGMDRLTKFAIGNYILIWNKVYVGICIIILFLIIFFKYGKKIIIKNKKVYKIVEKIVVSLFFIALFFLFSFMLFIPNSM